MKRFALLLIMLCASGIVSMAQDYSYEANPKKFDLSIGGQLFSGDGGLMDFSVTDSIRTGQSVPATLSESAMTGEPTGQILPTWVWPGYAGIRDWKISNHLPHWEAVICGTDILTGSIGKHLGWSASKTAYLFPQTPTLASKSKNM